MNLKRLLTLVLSLVLLVSVVSMSFAAVTVGGNVRVWYQSVNDESAADIASDAFRFDRLALTFASELSAVDGFKGEVQFRTPMSKNENDVRVDSAYYYQKAMFLTNDEFNIGYISQLPFKGSYNAIVLEDLANAIVKNTNSVGIKYADKIGNFDFAVAVLNAKNQYAVTDTTYQGFDYGLRVNYVVIPGLKLGLAYVDDVTNSDKYNTAYLFDVTYSLGDFGAYAEYVSASKTAAGSTTDYDGATYLELSYKVTAPLTVYVGGTAGLGTDTTSLNQGFSYTYTKDSVSNLQATGNWMLAGLKYQLAPGTVLQAEYVSVDDSNFNKTVGAVRCLVAF